MSTNSKIIWNTLALALMVYSAAHAGVLDNLQLFDRRLDTGDPAVLALSSLEGPKGIASADLNGDTHPDLAVANVDGTVTVYFAQGAGLFSPALHLHTGGGELRGIVCADFTGDGFADIATAAPYDGAVYLFLNGSGGTFSNATTLHAWRGARNLAAGDFDGDGRMDLAVGGPDIGVRQYQGLGGGVFQNVGDVTAVAASNADFPKPVYSLKAARFPGTSRDELVVTHADTPNIWVLSPNIAGVLQVAGTITNSSSLMHAHALEVGALLQPSAAGALELVTAHRDAGTVEIRAATAGAGRFSATPAQTIHVPGGPRAITIIDLDNDGWNDLVVVLRNFDCVQTYRNQNGTLVPFSQSPVGISPRELTAGDFNWDGRPDVAVMNRDSADISLLYTHPGTAGFSLLTHVYPNCDDVSGMAVLDLNGDGRSDVVQLHRAPSDLTVRLSAGNGMLSAPVYYSMGTLPSALSVIDVNGDMRPDALTANLGRSGIENGTISVRLGNGDGTFGAEMRSAISPGDRGGLFALVAADFDRDGDIDLAAGFFDCRLAFFSGNNDGTFTLAGVHFFTFEARAMVAGDFDQDNDMDLAGAGYAGDVVVIENRGDLLTTTNLARQDFPAPSSDKFGTRALAAVDVNFDADLDLMVGSGKGTMVYLGGAGMSFTLQNGELPGTAFAATGQAYGDFNNDGELDLAVASRYLSCVTVLSRDTNGAFQPLVNADVPSGLFIASGDVDGDGQVDLVGSGNALWTALSSRSPQPGPPALISQTQRSGRKNHPVLNELLAINNLWPLDADGGRRSDWVEVYNGGSGDMLTVGWRLRLVRTAAVPPTTAEYRFPVAVLPRDSHLVLVCSDRIRSQFHTGFNLPGEGGILTLIDASGAEVDRIEYPRQQDNLSFGRYRDGLPALSFNSYPNPGRPNVDNGPVEPAVDLEGFDIGTFRPGHPIRFNAFGIDDVGIVSLCLMYKRLDISDNETHRVVLYDDGMHEDGGLLDGRFSGLLEPGLPAGAEVQFYIEVVDLSDQMVIIPDEPIFARVGEPVNLYSFAVGMGGPSLEISEVLSWNTSGIRDEQGDIEDWIELRNCSPQPLALAGLGVSSKFFANNSRFVFPSGLVLQPGQHTILFCDEDAAPLHTPFALSRDGEELFLTGATANGARLLVDYVQFGAAQPDRSFARLGCDGPWRVSQPTPASGNISDAWAGLVNGDGTFSFGFPTAAGKSYTVETTDSLSPPVVWSPQPPIAGDGIEKVVTQPIVPRRFYRVRSN